jgi:hypothetical protein
MHFVNTRRHERKVMVEWFNYRASYSIGRSHVKNSVRRLAILTELYRDFPLSHHENFGIVAFP